MTIKTAKSAEARRATLSSSLPLSRRTLLRASAAAEVTSA
jgi:hypothetical protein